MWSEQHEKNPEQNGENETQNERAVGSTPYRERTHTLDLRTQSAATATTVMTFGLTFLNNQTRECVWAAAANGTDDRHWKQRKETEGNPETQEREKEKNANRRPKSTENREW